MFQTIFQTVKMHDFQKVAFYAWKIGNILVITVTAMRNFMCNFRSALPFKQGVRGSNPRWITKETRDFSE